MSERPPTDLWIVASLAALGLTALGGIVTLSLLRGDVPPSLVAVSSTVVGALASFLVHLPRPPRNGGNGGAPASHK